ncbi:deoxyguanosinetriphosphate triphosphohydrolase family protein [Mycobacteroides abscessus]|uniref:deoxyguanosinetriphosphate triphosphohydrolase family protein n=1 Tax=Mycobacteroides abscessus TaxID=36809 RepID=UPI0012FFEE61|nr:dNTP triphosphohydrolase [Mycobacteroides abscessus]
MTKSKPEQRVIRIPAVGNLASGETRDSLRYSRLSGRSKSSKDQRDEAQRDIDRITYSTAWRRLAGVTQVVTPFSDRPLLHNRLTHSQKVAQVARSIAENLISNNKNHQLIAELGGLDVDVCVAAALAHDIGHPPFGHVGESVLDEIAQTPSSKEDPECGKDYGLGLQDGFEGNAQSIRILAVGNRRSVQYQGLDLTLATLCATAKYPWTRAVRRSKKAHNRAMRPGAARANEEIHSDATYRRTWRKFNFYREHQDILERCRSFLPDLIGEQTQSIEASIMDVADDISYSIHDLEDFLLMGGILNTSAVRSELANYGMHRHADASADESRWYTGGIGKLASRLELDYFGWFDRMQLSAAAGSLASSVDGIFAERSALRDATTHAWASAMVEDFIRDIQIKEHPCWNDGPHVSLSSEMWHTMQLLKFITKKYVIEHPDMALLQHGQERILEDTISRLVQWSGKDSNRLPARLMNDLADAALVEATPEKRGYGFGKVAIGPHRNRAFVDYICSLSDEECMSIFRKLSGISIHHPFGYSS